MACVDEALRLATGTDAIFGGKTIVLLGDFRQTCPVIPRGTRQDVIDASIRSSPLWSSLRIFHLSVPVRNAEDPEFSIWVDAVGDGVNTEVDLSILEHQFSTADQMINFVFPAHILADPSVCARRSILAVTNSQVDQYNNRILQRILGTERKYYACDTVKGFNNTLDGTLIEPLANPESDDEQGTIMTPQAILDHFIGHTPSGCPPWCLTIKEGAVYRLLRNFSIEKGLVKNSRVLVVTAGEHVIRVHLLTAGIVNEDDLLIPRICFEFTMPSTVHTLLRRQFPLAPAYATTFNSCQGLTLDRCAIDLTTPAFSHGQLYTALSRVRRREHCAVRLTNSDNSTQNVTYTELLI
jgi:ATP-dependent DNA helicase PIF1